MTVKTLEHCEARAEIPSEVKDEYLRWLQGVKQLNSKIAPSRELLPWKLDYVRPGSCARIHTRNLSTRPYATLGMSVFLHGPAVGVTVISIRASNAEQVHMPIRIGELEGLFECPLPLLHPSNDLSLSVCNAGRHSMKMKPTFIGGVWRGEYL